MPKGMFENWSDFMSVYNCELKIDLFSCELSFQNAVKSKI